MAWTDNGGTVVFECDGCEAVETFDNATFLGSWPIMQEKFGWRSLKRIGHPWTFHCAKCGPQAEVEHREHKRREAERDRLKTRNARD